ncbi:hypothetical protein GCM10023205_52520 [Yinghuangia aomiensis]|uniref:Metallothionein n=1 Tax=Yinghuangia aomiensis TaxID=676205 RepID=A0ABP9HT99_9ACTN
MKQFDDFDDEPDDDFDHEPNDEWRHGECDRCAMSPGEVIEPFGICCACSSGLGAPPDECVCGPDAD